MAHSKLYSKIMNSKEWRRLRNTMRQRHPFCEECARKGRVSPTQAIHHIVEIETARTPEEAWSLALSESNLMAVCFDCHREMHTGSHTREASKQRKEDRLAAWIAQQTGG